MSFEFLEKSIKRYFDSKHAPAAVYLFGSTASGISRRMSDVDIGLLFSYQYMNSIPMLREEYMAELGRILKKDIHLVSMNHAGEVLLKQILTKGKPVLIKDQNYHRHFTLTALTRIADFNFYLEKMQTGLRKKIMEI